MTLMVLCFDIYFDCFWNNGSSALFEMVFGGFISRGRNSRNVENSIFVSIKYIICIESLSALIIAVCPKLLNPQSYIDGPRAISSTMSMSERSFLA